MARNHSVTASQVSDQGLIGAEASYHAQWRAFAIRRNSALFLLLAWLPLSVALFVISRSGWHRPVPSLIMIFLWLAVALAAVWWAGEFRCPRCRRRYGALGHKKGDVNLTRGLFDKVCSNCKLRKFERPASALAGISPS